MTLRGSVSALFCFAMCLVRVSFFGVVPLCFVPIRFALFCSMCSHAMFRVGCTSVVLVIVSCVCDVMM